jgi:predicted Zn-dependent protease with MMP-like domain
MATVDDPHLDDVHEQLDGGLDALERGDLRAATRSLEILRRIAGKTAASTLLLEAKLIEVADGPAAAVEHYRRGVDLAPEDAELRLALAYALEATGDHQGMVRQLLVVRSLDAQADRDAGGLDPALIDRIEAAAAAALDELPADFHRRIAHVPIVLEPRPSIALVRDGFDPRGYGLFEGPNLFEDEAIEGVVEAPTRIVLFTANLAADFDEDELAEQVRITILHEVGHYFGMSEEDMERLGLD